MHKEGLRACGCSLTIMQSHLIDTTTSAGVPQYPQGPGRASRAPRECWARPKQRCGLGWQGAHGPMAVQSQRFCQKELHSSQHKAAALTRRITKVEVGLNLNFKTKKNLRHPEAPRCPRGGKPHQRGGNPPCPPWHPGGAASAAKCCEVLRSACKCC